MSDLTSAKSALTTKIVGAGVTSGAEANFAGVTSDGELKTAQTHNTSYVSLVKTVGVTEIKVCVGAGNLTGRRELLIYNLGPHDIYFGPTGVSASEASGACGIKITSQAFQSIPVGANVDVYLISGTASSKVIVQEFA